jgi:hypothetical protein
MESGKEGLPKEHQGSRPYDVFAHLDLDAQTDFRLEEDIRFLSPINFSSTEYHSIQKFRRRMREQKRYLSFQEG